MNDQQRDVIRQALEAFTSSWSTEKEMGDVHDAHMKAIAALRQLLEAAPVQLDPKDWTPCMKLPVVVHVRQQHPGESHVSTREGITPVKPDDLIMRGVSGEEYPIGRAIFEQTYTLNTTANPAPVQEPVAFDDWPEYHEHAMVCGLEDRGITYRYEAMRYGWDEALDRAWEAVNLHGPLYTTPPAQPAAWVGLTDEEVDEAARYCVKSGQSVNAAIRAIEAKLREKNGVAA
jgi:hypothetical protein